MVAGVDRARHWVVKSVSRKHLAQSQGQQGCNSYLWSVSVPCNTLCSVQQAQSHIQKAAAPWNGDFSFSRPALTLFYLSVPASSQMVIYHAIWHGFSQQFFHIPGQKPFALALKETERFGAYSHMCLLSYTLRVGLQDTSVSKLILESTLWYHNIYYSSLGL